MKRPNKLDYIVYNIWRWWWNPILRKNPHLAKGIAEYMLKWVEENK